MKTTPYRGWGIRVTSTANSAWLWNEVFDTRTAAISFYNERLGDDAAYEKRRRNGLIRAVKVCVTVEDLHYG